MTTYCKEAWRLYDLREQARDRIESATPAERTRLVIEYRNANRMLLQHRIECSGNRTGLPEDAARDAEYCTMPVRATSYEEAKA